MWRVRVREVCLERVSVFIDPETDLTHERTREFSMNVTGVPPEVRGVRVTLVTQHALVRFLDLL